MATEKVTYPTPEERIERARARRLALGANSQTPEKHQAQARSSVEAPAAADLSDRRLAEAWARSTGLVSIPKKPSHEFNGWLCFLLAWFWLIPAIIYYFICQSAKNAYNTALDEALIAWRQNGSPDPYASKDHGGSAQAKGGRDISISEKLSELMDLRERGVLSEEEFVAAKRVVLGI
jgi:hypothetical protein